jgi:hypothetical protein
MRPRSARRPAETPDNTTPPSATRRTTRRRWLAAGLAAPMLLSVLPATSAVAESQVTGLTVEQQEGAALLRWDEVAGAENYEIERTPVSSSGSAQIVGIHRPDRTLFALEQPDHLSFADAGFVPGERYRWRVRAAGMDASWSDPVEADTLPFQGPEEFRLQWESSGATQWTNHDNEIDFGERLAEASPRMRLETIGETVQGRRIDMYVIGDPPPATTEAIARRPSLLLQCQVHGNEPAPREACMIVARELALSSDRWVNDLLRNMTVLIVPAINGDGRANNTRGNATGQDLNRDYSLIRQPETRAFVEVLQQYRPDVVVDGHEFGNNNTGDLPLLWPRHRNVSPAMSEEGQRMVREFFFTRGADEGWWTTPYPWPSVGAGLGQETILRNTLGLKNHVGMLLESRVQAGPTRPGAGGNQTAVNQRRRVYSHVWTYRTAMDYHRQDFEQIQATIRASKAFNLANEGPVYLNGAWDAPDVAPIDDPPTLIVDPAPCGYRLSMDDYTATRSDGPTVQQRLEAHGMRVENEGDTVLVRLAQEQRGLIPLILDDEAPETMVAGERVYDCDTPTCPGTLTLVNTDTGITDRPANDQVCVSQLLDDQQPFRTNGEFVRYINEQTRQLRIDRILTPTEASRLVTTAARN